MPLSPFTPELPDYRPPNAKAAELAAGGAPLIVLAATAAVLLSVLSAPAFFAILATTTLWLIREMTVFQRAIDGYSRDFADRHLTRRADGWLKTFVSDERNDPETRAFVARYVAAGRHVLADGQLP